jgi:large subunit ribosomal protein L31e
MSDPQDTVIEERLYTVSFSKTVYGRRIPRRKRTPRAVRYLKQFIQKHLKSDLESIIIDPEVNEFLWSRGIQKPPRRIRVRAVKTEDETVEVFLA